MSEINDLPPDILEQVKKCAAVLRSGGIAAYPTDTVYGLGADIYNDKAVAKVFAVKRRPLNLPLPVLICDQSQLEELTADVPASARRLITSFWPGALTIVFNKAPSFNSLVTAGKSKIAVRMPAHAITLRLIKEAGCPIVGTSANLHGLTSALTTTEVRSQLGTAVDFTLEGGPCPGGTESTIVDVTGDKPSILRTGAIPEEALRDLQDRTR
jgi:L-threonylcarbamoyladenylate synthase